ncbi:proteasome adapter and scaffold protein ECM29 isoform X2 [Rhodamnia argentea]|uniref:Proteasome adapter and scaffold protein ECM29 isoform X2 n=1 Tax=Rhodamnia argentea TaxID=178133 RepID=A0A8B8NIA8_9MYRT|nr:proteasome adapter and scaffold protein ECM29 isoform X2 [Rhodamnia argentea]
MAESSSSPANAMSDAELEEMLDRMLTRLALCDDSNLQALLSKLLPLAISSLSSPSSAVRNKVLEILSHVNKRVKHQPEIGLPLSDLWRIYTEANVVSIVKNFCILYIEMAFDRSDVKEKEMMAPILAANVSKLPHQHQEIVLRIAAKVIGECHSTGVNEEVAAMYKAITNSQDKEGFIEFCLHNILYQPSSQGGGSSPGLSIAQANRLLGKHQLMSNTLLMRKLGFLNVVEAMELTPEVVYPLYLAATADSQEAVAMRGDELLKKKASGANFDDPSLIKRLFLLFNGSTGADSDAPDSRIAPANSALKAKLMSVFCRSITAANSFPWTLQCIFGCIYGQGTTTRLKQLGMEFTVWVFKHAKLDQLNLIGPVILGGILKTLDGYSGSESDSNAKDTKTFAFQAIGLLAKRTPQLFRDKVDMAARLFDALKLEAPSLRFTIQEATVSLAAAYKDASTTVLKDLEPLLLENLKQEQSEVRFCAVRWATMLFDLQHCPSRFLCMLGAADPKLDIREMALEGLFPGNDNGHPTRLDINWKYPKLGDMLTYILKQRPELLESIETREQQLLFPSETYVAMIKFLLKCFESEKLLSETDGGPSEISSSVKNVCLLLDHAMAFEGSVELHACASRALVAFGSHTPQVIVPHYANKLPWLKQLLSHVDIDTRETAARLLGMASSGLPTTAASALISELVFSVSDARKIRFDYHYGAVCAIGYITADCICRTPPIPEVLLQSVLKCLVDVVNSENATLASIAMQALGHIGLRVSLPSIADDSTSADIFMVLQEKLRKLLSGDDTKAIQKIAVSLGHVCMKETSSSRLNIAIDLVFSLCRSKVEDVLFAAGEALSFLWGTVPVTADTILKTNYTSLSMSSNYLMENMSTSLTGYISNGMIEETEGSRVSMRDAITRKLFDGLLYSPRKEERCAGTVWLLSLTMYCGHHATIQQMLPEIQEVFSQLLGEQNELTQELASQGMSIVYELGDASMKKNLVNALVNTLTGSGKRKRAIKLVEDSEVFQEGAIGESLSGGKLSTYKELCNMANEMGQPDLIYKFMDLANHHASLNSKRGAAFGFSKIAKQAGDALQPHLRVLIPRLVRYQYDPDKNVQDAMAHIWKALVEDSKRTIDEHFDLIMDDLLTQCGSRLWRTREASCLALADIIQGRKFNQVGKHLKKLWIAAFRAMDDIKETVRNSGDKLCRAVTSLTIRLCDVNLTEASDSRQAMDVVLPYLLKEGILSMVDTVRKASIAVVMKLAKGAGIALRPHLADLVSCMLESLSSLEDPGLNYFELHATNIGLKTEKLENLRISIAKSSPMWETLDQCINVVDTISLESLVPRIAQMVRASVGLNTRVGVASFIGLLVQKVGIDIKPFANTLLKLLFGAVREEKSAAAKRAFSSACALVLKHASTSQAQMLIEDTTALHAGDKNSQISCAILLKSFLSTAPDVVSGYYAEILPVIFISRFEDDKNLSGIFEELWEENTSGERITLQLYMREIVSLICDNISSSSWGSKKKAAQAICKLGEVLGESLSPCHQVLLISLMKELPGRLWEGKEALLYALGALSKSCHQAISKEDPNAAGAILDLLSSACTKKVKKYREAALLSLDQVIKAFGNHEFFNMVFPLLFDMCSSATSDKSGLANDSAKSDYDGKEDSSVPLEKVLDCVTSCIHVAHIDDILEQKNNLNHLWIVSLSPELSWTVKLSAFLSIKGLCSRIHDILLDCQLASRHANTASLFHELFCSVSPKVAECIATIKIAQVHISASECLLEMITLCRELPSTFWTDAGLKDLLAHQHEVEKNGQAKSLLKRCIQLLETS